MILEILKNASHKSFPAATIHTCALAIHLRAKAAVNGCCDSHSQPVLVDDADMRGPVIVCQGAFSLPKSPIGPEVLGGAVSQAPPAGLDQLSLFGRLLATFGAVFKKVVSNALMQLEIT